MKLFALVILFCNTHTIDVTGDWVLKYKTFGKKVEQEFFIRAFQDGIGGMFVSSSDKEFSIYLDGSGISWEMKVPGIRSLVNAQFKGEFESSSRMSGVVVLSEYPMSGKAVKWTAARKESGENRKGK